MANQFFFSCQSSIKQTKVFRIVLHLGASGGFNDQQQNTKGKKVTKHNGQQNGTESHVKAQFHCRARLLDVTKNFIVKLKGLHTFNQSADKQLSFNKQLHRKKERKKEVYKEHGHCHNE